MTTTPGNDADETTHREPESAAADSGHLIPPFEDHPAMAGVPAEHHIEEQDTDDEITEKLRRQGVRLGWQELAPGVFWPSAVLVLTVVAAAVIWPAGTGTVFGEIQGWIVDNLGWYYVLIVAAFVFFAIGVGASRLGTITLGRDGEEPEYSTLSWFSMLFAAGMGIGLVFYGVAEPLIYATVDKKPGWDGDEAERTGLSMAQTFVHWGLHPWAIYAVIGLALAYAIHRRGRPVSIRWALEPLLGDRVKGWAGDLIDVLAVLGTVFGVATSLGLGVQQIAAGLDAIGLVADPTSKALLITLIVVITFVATMSVISGIGAGIKWLSNINLSLAGILLAAVLVLGPTLFIFRNFVESLGFYLGNVLQMTFDVGAFQGEAGQAWYQSWTIFYWGWWISWAPFVGVFIARISRGRTVRQFIAGVLLAPTLVGFVWFAVMGGAGLFRQLFGEKLVEDGADSVDAPSTLFAVLDGLPLGQIFSVLAIIVIALFFITSSDSGSLVVDMLASGGHPNPPTWSRVLWSVIEGAVAISLLLAGGLGALQSAALATALPFSIVLVLMCFAVVRGLRYEYRKKDLARRRERFERAADLITGGIPDDPRVRSYVDNRIDYRLGRTKGGLHLRRQNKDD
ncbi:MAG: BCCT family transporter [Gordonia sp. (in: high G+C Gram-positive bacteria)]|uniref:BCCT family transporter n=1 Tax=Gordonia sp. (in: high G+C Gram-positive bacteria) TaxID=84139 RepID=UPI0039E27855